MIEVENLVKKYGGHTAVDHLSFRVEKGQIYGFLGPNGAGKSTTMNIMTGYLAATEGTVRINGYDILSQAEEAKKCIGYLPEIPPLYPDMTVYEYLSFAAELKKVPKKERREQITKVMDMTMVGEVSGRLIKNLSKGFRQRVGLAQALLGSPEVLILDEPTVGLDPRQIIEIRDLIRRLGKDHTVILSSHILSEVSAVCDHIMIISEGRMVASDSPEGLQKLQSGKTVLKLLVIGKEEKIKDLLGSLPCVKEIICKTGPEPDTLDLTIEGAQQTDLSRPVGKALAENRVPVLSMNAETGSLEDIFLTLTASETEGKDPEATEEKATEERNGQEASGAQTGEMPDGEKGPEENGKLQEGEYHDGNI